MPPYCWICKGNGKIYSVKLQKMIACITCHGSGEKILEEMSK